jgi:cyclase
LDIDLIKKVTSLSKVPVIAHGGAGNTQHIIDAIKIGKANAVALGSMVVYQKKDFGVLINFPDKTLLETFQKDRMMIVSENKEFKSKN